MMWVKNGYIGAAIFSLKYSYADMLVPLHEFCE
jgi:hypothetical protein